MVYEALSWLHRNNRMYNDIVIDNDYLAFLPKDGIPTEILTIIHHEEDEGVAESERETYIPSESKL